MKSRAPLTENINSGFFTDGRRPKARVVALCDPPINLDSDPSFHAPV